jgi:hypothetical protein
MYEEVCHATDPRVANRGIITFFAFICASLLYLRIHIHSDIIVIIIVIISVESWVLASR